VIGCVKKKDMYSNNAYILFSLDNPLVK